MKICVLGLDGAAMDLIADERLVNLRRLMEVGLYGQLENVVPHTEVSSWICMATSRDQDSSADSTSSPALAIWDHLAAAGRQSVLIGVPPSYPPRRVNGVSIGAFLASGAAASSPTRDFAWPPEIQSELRELLGDYPMDEKDFAATNSAASPDELRDEIILLSDRQWQAGRLFLGKHQWDYFHFVDSGLEFLLHLQTQANTLEESVARNVAADYLAALDEQVGSVLELLDDQTIVLVLSTQGTQLSTGGSGTSSVLNREGAAGPGADHAAPLGVFVLAAPNCPLTSEYHGAHLIDMAPTLLDLAGYEIPASMQGRSLVAGLEKKDGGESSAESDEKLLLDRLSGLGYV